MRAPTTLPALLTADQSSCSGHNPEHDGVWLHAIRSHLQAKADARREYGGAVPRDGSLLHHLLRAHNKETGRPFSELEIMAQGNTFLLAGAASTEQIPSDFGMPSCRFLPFSGVKVMAQGNTLLLAGGIVARCPLFITRVWKGCWAVK